MRPDKKALTGIKDGAQTSKYIRKSYIYTQLRKIGPGHCQWSVSECLVFKSWTPSMHAAYSGPCYKIIIFWLHQLDPEYPFQARVGTFLVL